MKRHFFKTVLHALLACAVVSAFCGVARAGAFPARSWTYRVKSRVMPATVVFPENGAMVFQSDMDVIHVVDISTGANRWEYALDGPAQLYAMPPRNGASGLVLAATQHHVHLLDTTAGKRLWSAFGCTTVVNKVIVYEKTLRASCAEGDRDRDFQIDTGKRIDSGPNSMDIPIAFPDRVIALTPQLLGADTFLDISSATATLSRNGSEVWSYAANKPLAPTAALHQGKLFLITASGTLTMLNPDTGAFRDAIDLTKVIDMRFWDELPQNVNYYGEGILFSHGEFLYVIGPSSLSQIKILPFPEEISISGAARDSTAQFSLNKAIKAWDRQEFALALQNFQEAATLWPDSPDIVMFLGMAYSSLRAADPSYIDLAIQNLEKAHELDPGNPDITANLLGNYMIKIMSLDPKFQQKKILQIYQKAAVVSPTSFVSYMGMIEVYLGDKNFSAAAATVEKSLEHGFFGSDQYNLLLATRYLSDDYQAAEAAARSAIEMFPRDRIPYVLLAKLYSKLGSYSTAIHTFESAPPDAPPDTPPLSLFPRLLTAGAEFFYCNALGLIGRYDDAIQKLTAYIKTMPTKQELAELQDILKKQAQEPNKDIEIPEKLRSKFKGKTFVEVQAERDFLVPAMLSLAHFQYRMGRKDESVRQLAAVENLADNDHETLSYVGYFYALNKTDLAKALKYTESAVKAFPNDVVFLRNYAVALWRSDRIEESEAAFKQAIDLDSPTEFLCYDYGMMLLDQKNRRDEAVAQFLEELRLSPEVYEVKKMLESMKVPVPEQ